LQIDASLKRGGAVGKVVKRLKGPLEMRHRLRIGGTAPGLGPGLAQIRERLVPRPGLKRVMGELLHVLRHPARVSLLNDVDEPGMELAAAPLQQAPVGDLVRERVLERVLGFGKELRLVEELGRL